MAVPFRMLMLTVLAVIAGIVVHQIREATCAGTPATARNAPTISIASPASPDRRTPNLKSPSKHVPARLPRTRGPAPRLNRSRATSRPTPVSGASITCPVGSSTARRSLSGAMQLRRKLRGMGVGGRDGRSSRLLDARRSAVLGSWRGCSTQFPYRLRC